MKIIIVMAALLMAGCANKGGEVIKVPVWTPPKFERPVKPVLKDTADSKTEGEVVRAVEINTLELMKYATDLEKIVEQIK